MTPYRTIVFAEIVQEGALTVGGNEPHGLVDVPLARDGRQRPVLRGSTLAGCFIATARAIAGTVPQSISCEEKSAYVPSSWRFAHAHLLGDEPLGAFLQHVSIDRRTLAARDDHLFSVEALPPGTRWNFELEIAPSSEESEFPYLERLAAAVLEEWRRPGGIRLGRGSRHGYGWCRLENISIIRLSAAESMLWPDAMAPLRTPREWVEEFRRKNVEVLDLDAFRAQCGDVTPAGRAVVELAGEIHIGERADDFGKGYGVDMLSVGGHARMQLQARDFFERVIPPRDIPFREEDFDPDFVITAIPGIDGRLTPYVPGASIRGVWRAALERQARAAKEQETVIDTLFGTTERAGLLSVSDALPVDEGWKLIWQQNVAIDEFAGGAYGAAKFDRLAIAKGRFAWRARIEGGNCEQAESLANRLEKLLLDLGDGHLPLGGGIWRGYGGVRWTITSKKLRMLGAASEGEIR